MPLKAVLFDLDGTLAPTENLKAAALSAAVSHFGKSASPEVYKTVMGESWDTVTSRFFDVASLRVDRSVFNSIFREKYTTLIERDIVPDVATKEFVNRLKESNLKIALVSSAAKWMVDRILQRIDFANTFDVVITGDDVQNHKPDPEAYLLALRHLNVLASDAIVFEDSYAGFRAAERAGVPVYGIKHEFNEGHDFGLCQNTLNTFNECLSWPMFKDLSKARGRDGNY